MSFILDALRRSERERRAAAAPVLPDLAADPPAPPRRPWLPWVVGSLLVFNAAGLAYFLLKGRSPAVQARAPARPAPSTATAPAPIPPPAAAIPIPSPQPMPIPGQMATPPLSQAVPPPRPVTPPVAPPTSAKDRDMPPPTALLQQAPAAPVAKPLPGPARSPQTRIRPVPRPGATGAVGNSAIGANPAPALPPTKGRGQAAPMRPPTDFVPPRRDALEDAERPVRGHGSDLPLLGEMPPDFRARVPPLRINVFAYSKVPAERFAIIDMKKYLPGDQIPGGVQLLEIRQESLVLDMGGTRFRMPRP